MLLKNIIFSIGLFVSILFFQNCAPDCTGGSGDKNLAVSWNESHAYDVTSASGGGHKVYISLTPGITKSTPSVISVPNSTSTTSATIPGLVSRCTYFVRVGAYTALNPDGGELSSEQMVTIP